MSLEATPDAVPAILIELLVWETLALAPKPLSASLIKSNEPEIASSRPSSLPPLPLSGYVMKPFCRGGIAAGGRPTSNCDRLAAWVWS